MRTPCPRMGCPFAQEGWFVGLALYGYRNVRKDGRGVIEIDSGSAGGGVEHCGLNRIGREHVRLLAA